MRTVNGILPQLHYPIQLFTFSSKCNLIPTLKDKAQIPAEQHKKPKVSKKNKLPIKKVVLIFLQKHSKVKMSLQNLKSLKITSMKN